MGKDPHLCIRDLIKTTCLHPRKSAKGPWRQDNFNATGQPLKALNLLLAWCLCKLWLLPSWSTKCEQKLKLYPLQSQKVILAGPSLHVWKHVNDWWFLPMLSSHYTQMLHVGNICLHFPLNVGIFHPMYRMPLVFLSVGFGRRFFVRNSWHLASEPCKFSTNGTWTLRDDSTAWQSHPKKHMLANKLSEWQRDNKDPFQAFSWALKPYEEIAGWLKFVFCWKWRSFSNCSRSSRKPLHQALEIEIQQRGSLMLLSLGELTPKQRVALNNVFLERLQTSLTGWMNWRQPQPLLTWKIICWSLLVYDSRLPKIAWNLG